jgi:hypothetical protein
MNKLKNLIIMTKISYKYSYRFQIIRLKIKKYIKNIQKQ